MSSRLQEFCKYAETSGAARLEKSKCEKLECSINLNHKSLFQSQSIPKRIGVELIVVA